MLMLITATIINWLGNWAHSCVGRVPIQFIFQLKVFTHLLKPFSNHCISDFYVLILPMLLSLFLKSLNTCLDLSIYLPTYHWCHTSMGNTNSEESGRHSCGACNGPTEEQEKEARLQMNAETQRASNLVRFFFYNWYLVNDHS